MPFLPPLGATTAQGALAETAVQPGDLAAVATTGDYDDLTNRPTLGTAAAQDSTAFAPASHNHDAADINAGTLAVARGGTGIASYTAGNYTRASGPTSIEQRTPSQVLSDIGAAASSHTHTISAITDFLTKFVNVQTLSNSGGNVAYDIANGRNATLTLTGDWALSNLTDGGGNPAAGETGCLIIIQDGTGGRALTKPSNMALPDDAPFTFTDIASLGPNDIAVLTWLSTGSGNTKGWLALFS